MATSKTPRRRTPAKEKPPAKGSPSNAQGSTSPAPDPSEDESPQSGLRMIGRGVVPPVMLTREGRDELGLPSDDETPGRYMVELNIQYVGGLQKAAEAFEILCASSLKGDTKGRLSKLSKSYFLVRMSCNEWREMLNKDEATARETPRKRVIYKLWPDFKVKALMDRSMATVKADAAFRSYSASGAGVTWAVIDSGIDGKHPHFGSAEERRRHESPLYHPSVTELHRDFTEAGKNGNGDALFDGLGHGTHVAGIIAGGLPKEAIVHTEDQAVPGLRYAVYEQVFDANAQGNRILGKLPVERFVRKPEALRGVAPEATLVSLKVLDDKGSGFVSDIMAALVYIREELNDDPKMLRVHGVNLSVGYDFDAQMFACGQSPLCVEVDRLVKSGVVVVTAAGNTGYGSINASERPMKAGLSNTINDPGNASLAITVGSTHRDSPHTYGVSFFSSKGPTGDGRLKPDLVAPGERITSCAAASKCKRMGIKVAEGVAAYVDDSGTSMAAPHVSGAIAAFLSIRREFIQRPEEVKRIFLESATSLGRERYFEGHGLVDLMRAIQSV